MKETLEKVADTVLQEPVKLTITVKPKYFFQKPKQKVFEIRPLCFGVMLRISKLLLSVDADFFSKADIMQSCMKAISTHGETLAEALAIALTNNENKPHERLVKLIMSEFSSKDLAEATAIMLKQMDVVNFIRSISLIKGTNLLELSPKDQGR